MQDYIDIAAKNGVTLIGEGNCQFCGSETERGVHECVELFSQIAYESIDYSKSENHIFRFIAVDAHTLQHSEIHGRWNNHFHLTRQHLIFHYNVQWNYELSPKLSDHLNEYKVHNGEEKLSPPAIINRGTVTTKNVITNSSLETDWKEMITKWGIEVYQAWSRHHEIVDKIAQGFIKRNKSQLPTKPKKTWGETF